ncbi:hypothetical protein [Citrobacter freundii]|uniref:hypothetical protein n=1 Tax=Citrobacter freundii TaxID=546 RepID=UPI002DBBA4A7|nr:hypothetical protein [Citrobacter freundii]MEB6425760.1 hypothetical protein [Citrobacter freundii]
MYFVDNGSAVPVMPQVKPVSSATPQFFTEGGNGTPPTYPGPDWFNIFQLELLNVLKEAQIDPDKANHTQLVTAMKKLFLDASSNGSDIPDKTAFLANLGLSVFLHDAITSHMYSPDKKYNINVNNDGAWGCGITGSGGWNPLSILAGGTGASDAEGALANLASITTGGDYIIINLPGCRVQIFDRTLDSDPTIGNIKNTAVTFPVAFAKRCDFIGYSKYTNPATLCSCEGNTMAGFNAAVVNVLGVVGTTSQFRFIAWGE